MCVKKKNKAGFTLIEVIIVIGIIGIFTSIAVPNVIKFTRDKQVAHANDNARLVFMELQKKVNDYEYADREKVPTSANGTFDGTNIIQEIEFEDGSDADIVPQLSLPDDVVKGTWYAKIDNGTKTVKYVVWVEDYTINYESIDDIENLSQQKSHNDLASNKKQFVGLYPRGT